MNIVSFCFIPRPKLSYCISAISEYIYELTDLFLYRYSIQTNLVFVVNKSLWPQYHYKLPWDYQCGEYGNYNRGCITAHIRVWAALRLVTNLRTIDSDGMRKAMVEAATTGLDINQCAEKYAFDPNLLKIKCELDLERLPNWLKEYNFVSVLYWIIVLGGMCVLFA